MQDNALKVRLKRVINNPWRVFYHFNRCKISHLLSDKMLLKLIFRARMGKRLNINNPKTFNEKLQWLKLHDRKPEYSKLVDKYEVRNYISEKAGEQYLVPLYGVWNSFDEIDFSELPDQFVLKCNHDSGGVCICPDKDKFDFKNAKKTLTSAMASDFFNAAREYPYKNLPRRIIAEKYLEEPSLTDDNKGLIDYRVYCFNGEPKLIYTYQNKKSENGDKPGIASCDIFDTEWNHQPFKQKSANADIVPESPYNLNLIKDISKLLSEDIPFLRVDFYEVDQKIYVGELTFYPGAGFSPFYPEEWDGILGDWIKLPDRK